MVTVRQIGFDKLEEEKEPVYIHQDNYRFYDNGNKKLDVHFQANYVKQVFSGTVAIFKVRRREHAN